MAERREKDTLLRGGITGIVVAAVCCFTPVLVVLLGAIGLSAWLGWLNFVLFLTLVFFLALTPGTATSSQFAHPPHTVSSEHQFRRTLRISLRYNPPP